MSGDPYQRFSRGARGGTPVRRPTSRCACGATRIAVGIATIMPMANEVSQADTRFGANPSRAVVITSEITNDIATAMIAGTSSGAYLGSRRRPVTAIGPASPAASARGGRAVPSSGGGDGGICIWYSFALVLAIVAMNGLARAMADALLPLMVLLSKEPVARASVFLCPFQEKMMMMREKGIRCS